MSDQLIRFYIDDASPANYLGSWTFGTEAPPLDLPENAIEISSPPPVHASQKTSDGGQTWTEYVPE